MKQRSGIITARKRRITAPTTHTHYIEELARMIYNIRRGFLLHDRRQNARLILSLYGSREQQCSLLAYNIFSLQFSTQ